MTYLIIHKYKIGSNLNQDLVLPKSVTLRLHLPLKPPTARKRLPVELEICLPLLDVLLLFQISFKYPPIMLPFTASDDMIPLPPREVDTASDLSSSSESSTPRQKRGPFKAKAKRLRKTANQKASTSAPKSKNPLRPALDVLSRIQYDDSFKDVSVFVGYIDRHGGVMEKLSTHWILDPMDEEFIPQHKIRYFKRESDKKILWDRESRRDEIFGSGNGAMEEDGLANLDGEMEGERTENTGKELEAQGMPAPEGQAPEGG